MPKFDFVAKGVTDNERVDLFWFCFDLNVKQQVRFPPETKELILCRKKGVMVSTGNTLCSCIVGFVTIKCTEAICRIVD